MGLFTRLATMFKGQAGTESERGLHGLAPDSPVVVKWPPQETPEAGADAADTSDRPDDAPAQRNGAHDADTEFDRDAADVPRGGGHERAEHGPSADLAHAPEPSPNAQLAEEIKKNYAEVIDLVRKVNTHLDQQSHRLQVQEQRSERFAEIIEGLPAALATLPQIREQNAKMLEVSTKLVDAMTSLATTTREGQASIHKALLEQAKASRESAERIESLIERSTEAQDRAAGSIGDLATILGSTSQRLTDMFDTMQSRAAEREVRFEMAMQRGQRWVIVAVVIAIIAIVVAAVAVFSGLGAATPPAA